MQICVIDYHVNRINDFDRLLGSTNYEMHHNVVKQHSAGYNELLQLWNENRLPGSEDEMLPEYIDDLLDISNCGLILLHISNPWSKAFYEHRLKTSNKICFCYSGGDEGWYRQENQVHRFVSWGNLQNKLPDFIAKWREFEFDTDNVPWEIFDGNANYQRILHLFLPLDILLQGYILTDQKEVPKSWFEPFYSLLDQLFEKPENELEAIRKTMPENLDTVLEVVNPSAKSPLIQMCYSINSCRSDNGIKEDYEIVQSNHMLQKAHLDYISLCNAIKYKDLINEFFEFRHYLNHTYLGSRIKLGGVCSNNTKHDIFANKRVFGPSGTWSIFQRYLRHLVTKSTSLFGLTESGVTGSVMDAVSDVNAGAPTEETGWQCIDTDKVKKGVSMIHAALHDMPKQLKERYVRFEPERVKESLKETTHKELLRSIEDLLLTHLVPAYKTLEKTEDSVEHEKARIKASAFLPELLIKCHFYMAQEKIDKEYGNNWLKLKNIWRLGDFCLQNLEIFPIDHICGERVRKKISDLGVGSFEEYCKMKWLR